jgi:TFIIF-interacting CTD phosphatase-like protein
VFREDEEKLKEEIFSFLKPTEHNEGETLEYTLFRSSGFLPLLSPQMKQRRTLVLDLDETLIHSSFAPIRQPDFIVPIYLDNVVHRVFVKIRPFAKELLFKLSPFYEIVVFTASVEQVCFLFLLHDDYL